MATQKQDFVVQQSNTLLEADTNLKAGSEVALLAPDATGVTEVHYQGTLLGLLPSSQQHLSAPFYTCIVRSLRKQNGQITQILVRATPADAPVSHLPSMLISNSTSTLVPDVC